jgi:HK97 family phage portal protein
MTVWQRFRKFFEKRATLKDTYGWFVEHLLGGGGPTASGESVGPEKALTLSAYFAGVRAISEDIAKIPLILYRRKDERTKERATGHPLYRILHDSPNPEMSAMDFRSCMTANAINWGNAYAAIVRNGMAQVLALVPLESSRMAIRRNEENELRYVYSPDTGGEISYTPRQILHIRGLGSNGIQGYSIARLAREAIGLGLAEQKSGGAFFGNAGRPSAILECPQPLKREDQDKLREQWEAQYGGAGNAHKTAVLSGGITAKPFSVSNEDAQFIESRQFTVEDMARWLRVPPHIIGHLLRSTFSNIAVQGVEYVIYCLLSWAVRWEQEIQRKLIAPRNVGTFFAEHLFDGLLRGDIETRYRAYAIARQWGFKSANDCLVLENENPIGPAGDVYLVPANMMNADRLLEVNANVVDTTGSNSGNGEPDSETAPEGEPQEESTRCLELAERLCACLDIDAARIAAANGGNGNGSTTANALGGREQ